jgi:hypothetical protein
MTTKLFKTGMIVDNKLSNGAIIRCKMLGPVYCPFEGVIIGYRVTDARETEPTDVLIKTLKTWMAPIENLTIVFDEPDFTEV